MIISIVAEKAFNKNSTSIHTKNPVIEGNMLSLIKDMYKKLYNTNHI